MDVVTAHVSESVGPLWLVAVVGMFLSAVCESARPKSQPGEAKSQGIALLVAGIASLITPIMLFVYAFWSIMRLERGEISSDAVLEFIVVQRAVVAGLFIFLAGVAIIGSVIGWIIRAALPGFGRALSVAAVPLALATLALTVFVSHDAVAKFYVMATGPHS